MLFPNPKANVEKYSKSATDCTKKIKKKLFLQTQEFVETLP